MKSLDFNRQFTQSDDDQFQRLIRSVFLPWHSFDYYKKCSLFSQHTCHELNFFLFKRDQEFFEKVVKMLVENKLEKQFVD